MAKAGMTAAEIGIYEAMMFLGTALTFFWVTGLLNGLLPTYPSLEKSEKPKLLFNIFLVFIGLSLLVVSILWFGKSFIIPWLTKYETLPYYGLFCLYLLFHLPTFLIEFVYILREEARKIIIFGIFAFGGQLAVVTLPLFWGYGLKVSFQGLVILAIAKFIWLIYIVFRYTKPKFELEILRPYFVVAFPMVLYYGINGAAEYIDQTIVIKLFDEAQLAIYRFGSRESPITMALVAALSTAIAPKITEDLEDGLVLLKKRGLRIMHLLFLSSIVLMFISPILFPLVYNEEFLPSAWVFNVLLLIVGSRVLFPQSILLGLKKTKTILYVSLIEIILNIGLSLFFVQFWGLPGIVLATVITNFVEKIGLIIYTSKVLKISLHQYLHLNWWIFYNLLLVLAFLIAFFYF